MRCHWGMPENDTKWIQPSKTNEFCWMYFYAFPLPSLRLDSRWKNCLGNNERLIDVCLWIWLVTSQIFLSISNETIDKQKNCILRISLPEYQDFNLWSISIWTWACRTMIWGGVFRKLCVEFFCTTIGRRWWSLIRQRNSDTQFSIPLCLTLANGRNIFTLTVTCISQIVIQNLVNVFFT